MLLPQNLDENCTNNAQHSHETNIQAELAAARGRARHIGAVLGPGTRELIARMSTSPRQHQHHHHHHQQHGGGRGSEEEGEDRAGVCVSASVRAVGGPLWCVFHNAGARQNAGEYVAARESSGRTKTCGVFLSLLFGAGARYSADDMACSRHICPKEPHPTVRSTKCTCEALHGSLVA